MKKFYIVKFNGEISTAEYLGEYESLYNSNAAKEAAFPKMGDGDMLVEFNLDVFPEYTDEFGFETVNLDLANEKMVSLNETDSSMENVPEGLWYWSDEEEELTLYTKNGEKWYGCLVQDRGTYVYLYVDYKEIPSIDLSELSVFNYIKEHPGSSPETVIENWLENDIKKIESFTYGELLTEDRDMFLKELRAIYQELFEKEKKAAAKELVEESVSNNLQALEFDLRLLPDKLQPADIQKYGYKWDGILPLTKERAAELFDSDVTVYKLHPNSTETAVEDKILDIEQYDGMFGVEKRDWLIYLRNKIELMSEADREGLINGVEAGFDNGYDLAAEDIAIYHCLTSNVKLPEKLTEHSTGVEPVDKKGFGYEQPFRVIEKAHYNGQDLFLLASETPEYLDGNVITDENGNIIMENVRNGFTEYVENREYLVDRYDLRHPISFKTNSGDIVRINKYLKMPYNLKFVDEQDNAYKVYLGVIGDSEKTELILETSEGNYIYSMNFNVNYENAEIFLTYNTNLNKYNFITLGNSERINDLEAANGFEPIAATYEESKQLLLSDYIDQNREIADEVYISVGDASNRDYFDSPKEIYYGTLADLPKELLNAKVIDKSQIVASSFPERNGSWHLIIECIPQKEMTYAPEEIEQLIGNRKQTHYGIYADVSESLKDVPTQKLVEYYMEKSGEERLRNFLETEIIKAEILKEKNKNFCKSNSKTHEEYER